MGTGGFLRPRPGAPYHGDVMSALRWILGGGGAGAGCSTPQAGSKELVETFLSLRIRIVVGGLDWWVESGFEPWFL